MREEEYYFREMKIEDISEVASIERKLFSRPWSQKAFLEALEQDTLFVVVLDRNTIVGYCGMYCSFSEGEITNVAVEPSRQNQGIGHKMLKYLLEQAFVKGIGRVILEVRVSNANAIYLYESMGFQNCGIRRGLYEMPREDGMIMALELQEEILQ